MPMIIKTTDEFGKPITRAIPTKREQVFARIDQMMHQPLRAARPAFSRCRHGQCPRKAKLTSLGLVPSQRGDVETHCIRHGTRLARMLTPKRGRKAS